MRTTLQLAEPRHQVGEPDDISEPDERTTVADHDLRIGRDHVGPLPRHRADPVFPDAKQEPRS